MLSPAHKFINSYNLWLSIRRKYLPDSLKNPKFSNKNDLISLICKFNEILTTGPESENKIPGKFRGERVIIRNSSYVPPNCSEVPTHMNNLAEEILRRWHEDTVKLHSYVLWRLNWIHPFLDGNGRTSREFSYFLLCVRFGKLLPGKNTITIQIQENKIAHYAALNKADSGDFSAIENQSRTYLRNQLLSSIS